jgi:hypothetical protein
LERPCEDFAIRISRGGASGPVSCSTVGKSKRSESFPRPEPTLILHTHDVIYLGDASKQRAAILSAAISAMRLINARRPMHAGERARFPVPRRRLSEDTWLLAAVAFRWLCGSVASSALTRLPASPRSARARSHGLAQLPRFPHWPTGLLPLEPDLEAGQTARSACHTSPCDLGLGAWGLLQPVAERGVNMPLRTCPRCLLC